MHLPCPPAFKEPSTSSRPKSMSRSERPNWPPENLTHLHQVLKIKTPSGGQTLQINEGASVLPDRSSEVLRFHEPDILPARVAQYVTEGMHAPPAFGCERNVV